jgi:hypothetical protein
LDYGPFTSFAPSWDSEGAEIGRDCAGAVLEYRRQHRNKHQKPAAKPIVMDLDPQLAEGEGDTIAESESHQLFDSDVSLDVSLLLESLEVETEAERLLEKNAQAIERLRYLQNLRILRGESVVRDQMEHSTGMSLYYIIRSTYMIIFSCSSRGISQCFACGASAIV